MKLIFIILVMLFSFSALYGANESNIDAQYSKALKEYKTKNFSASYEMFSKLYLSKLSDVKLNFFFGRSAYETGHYEVALAAFERVEMLDSGNLRNRLEMARTYYMLKMYEESENAFKEVLDNPNIPQNVRTNIELYLSRVTKVQEKSFTYATVNVDWIYDSNVNYGSLDSEYNINTGTLPSTAEISDVGVQLYADIVNIYDIGKKNDFAIKNRFNAYMKEYGSTDAYDIKYFSYSPSLLYQETKYLVEFAVGVDDLYISNVDYMRSLYLTPRYELSHSTTLRSITYFKYQRKYFLRETEKDLDSNHCELAYSLQSILSPRSYIQGTFTGIKESRIQGTRIDVNYVEYRANVVYANQFTPIYGTELFAEYRRRNYDDFSTLFASTRSDDAGTLTGSINARLLKTLRLHLKGSYSRVKSNQERFSYEKTTLTFGLNKTF